MVLLMSFNDGQILQSWQKNLNLRLSYKNVKLAYVKFDVLDTLNNKHIRCFFFYFLQDNLTDANEALDDIEVADDIEIKNEINVSYAAEEERNENFENTKSNPKTSNLKRKQSAATVLILYCFRVSKLMHYCCYRILMIHFQMIQMVDPRINRNESVKGFQIKFLYLLKMALKQLISNLIRKPRLSAFLNQYLNLRKIMSGHVMTVNNLNYFTKKA